MTKVLDNWLVNRDPPTFWEVEELANVYLKSREFQAFSAFSIEPVYQNNHEAIKIAKSTLMIWDRRSTTSNWATSYAKYSGYDHAKGWNCILIHSDLTDTQKLPKNLDINNLPNNFRLLKCYSSWQRALYDAISREWKIATSNS